MFNIITKESTVYCDGLTIEEEPFKLIRNEEVEKFETDFSGTVITGHMNAKSFSCTTLNKNIASLKDAGVQKKARYPPAISYIHDKTKLGVIIGSAIRIKDQNTTEEVLLNSLKDMLYEMKMIGYKKEFLIKAMHRIKKKSGWKARTRTLMKYIYRIY